MVALELNNEAVRHLRILEHERPGITRHADAPDLFYKLRVTSISDLPQQKEVEAMMDPERGDCLVRFDRDNLAGELIPWTFKPASRH